MITAELLGHGDGAGVTHMDVGSIWMVLSMVGFSLFLLAFAWALLRPAKHSRSTEAGNVHGTIDADDYERIMRDIESRPH